MLYGSNMSNSNAHNHFPLPNLLVGGAAVAGRAGTLELDRITPRWPIYWSPQLDKAGVPQGDSRRQHGPRLADV